MVRIPINLQLLFRGQLKFAVGLKPNWVFAVDQNVFMGIAYRFSVFSRISLLPDDARDKPVLAENFVQGVSQAMYFAVIDADRQDSRFR